MLNFVPVAFFPTEDRSEFSVDYTLPEGTNISTTKNKSLVLAEAINSYAGVENIIISVGAANDKKPNKANLIIKLVNKNERRYSQSQLIDRLRTDLRDIFEVDGAEISLNIAGAGGGHRAQPIQLIFKSSDWAALESFSDEVAQFTKNSVAGAVDVVTSKPKAQNEYTIMVDTTKAADLGLSSADIASTMRTLFEGEQVGTIVLNGHDVDIKLRIADHHRSTKADIAGISLASLRGSYVSLNSVASINYSSAPATIERFDNERQITVLANFNGKDLNAAINQITDFVKEKKPSNITMILSGQAEIMKDAIFAMIKALFLAILLVFIILCIQYESYSSPLVIMVALPLSLTGAFSALLITGQVMSIYAMIGIILLMGLVTKNGILLVDFAMQKIREGLSVTEALLVAAPLRLRPILMTTAAAGGGMIPVAIGHGIGGEARSPMGVAVIGGLIASTLLTLVIVPCLFSVMADLKIRAYAKLRSK
jgi:HAE1 family hydrophobic/amphiphilic exporter-1